MPRMVINLSIEEVEALVALAIYKHREPRQQAAYIIRQHLEHLGLIDSFPSQHKKAHKEKEEESN